MKPTSTLASANMTSMTNADDHCIKLLSFNIQVGMASTHMHHYVTQCWKHLLPHSRSFDNLDRIADVISQFDLVALQEADGGSMRSFFINQVEYLAKKADFPHWHKQTNRNLGKFAQHSNGLLSKFKPYQIVTHKLPGLLPGRGVMEARYGTPENPLIVLMAHLALSKSARTYQFNFIGGLVNQFEHVVVMGDMNCQSNSDEMTMLLRDTNLSRPETIHNTYPSWKPVRNIDHILTTQSVKIRSVEVINETLSDHLPLAVEIQIPQAVTLQLN
ncbi:MAG: endonuclease/exonuclease/phosphatase family protein [Thiotrichaceae bacterium]|nr:endonuclease/exonuclease/phosphatase family protein [Thiotrichaceae bacterium]